MFLPTTLLILCLIVALIGLIYTVKRKVQQHTHHPPPR